MFALRQIDFELFPNIFDSFFINVSSVSNIMQDISGFYMHDNAILFGQINTLQRYASLKSVAM